MALLHGIRRLKRDESQGRISQSTISGVLNGARSLTRDQVIALGHQLISIHRSWCEPALTFVFTSSILAFALAALLLLMLVFDFFMITSP